MIVAGIQRAAHVNGIVFERQIPEVADLRFMQRGMCSEPAEAFQNRNGIAVFVRI
jgi:hypothetical protein